MNRGFIVLFIPVGADISDPASHQMVACIGENEEEVATGFVSRFGESRQMVGVLSLEEIEEHRRLIIEHAKSMGVELDRAGLP